MSGILSAAKNYCVHLEAWRSLRETYRVVYAKVNSDLRRYRLTPPQYSVIRVIGNSEIGSFHMSEVSNNLIVADAYTLGVAPFR